MIHIMQENIEKNGQQAEEPEAQQEQQPQQAAATEEQAQKPEEPQQPAEEPQQETESQECGHEPRQERRRKMQAAKKEIEELKQQVDSYKDQYLRLQAEFDNYRRRTSKERLELIGSAGKDVLVGFLPVLDDCQRAIKVLKESEASQAAIEGTELIMNKLMGYLASKGIARIDAVGKEFDTDFHEAVAQFPVQDPEQKNKVFDVTQEGYTLNGTVVRYAKVVVGI